MVLDMFYVLLYIDSCQAALVAWNRKPLEPGHPSSSSDDGRRLSVAIQMPFAVVPMHEGFKDAPRRSVGGLVVLDGV